MHPVTRLSLLAYVGLVFTARAEAPSNAGELAARMAALRSETAPFLRSLPPKVDARTRRLLSGDDWLSRFEIKRVSDKPAKAMAPRPTPPGWERADLDMAAWERTSVPEWRYDDLARTQPASCILWYRKAFKAERARAGTRVFLVFEGVDWEAEVWLNGRRLGGHSVYCEPFRFDVTETLAEENTLAVRVIDGPQFGEPAAYWAVFPVPPAADQRYVRDRGRSLAGLQNGDSHVGSGYGVHRDVYLETTGPAVVSEVLVRGYPARGEAVVQVATDVASTRPATLKVDVLPENFEGTAFTQSAPFEPSAGSGRQTVTVKMPDARRWSPDAPWLYRCRVTLQDGVGHSTDVRDAVFGCRAIELVSEQAPREGLQAGTLLLDGRPLFLRGANIQGLNALWLWGEHAKLLEALLLLKAADFNAVRSCQHLQFPEVRELLDRLGIFSQQDVGSRYPGLGEQVRPGLLAASAAVARQCYNNPGVALLSFANETHFDPSDMLRAALAVDPDRLFKPISGHPHGGTVRPNKGQSGYTLPGALWARVIDDVHPYWGWYGYQGALPLLCQVLDPDRMVTVGEYGSEALDSYMTMAHYPPSWGPRPALAADTLWGQVQVTKDGAKQVAGFRGRRPANLGAYIAASQNYQYDQLAEVTKAWRLSPRRIAGYFQFHFIDVLPANWPKSIVSHDLTPKRAYFAMAQVNQPLVPLPRLVAGGQALELWVANDEPRSHAGCGIRWAVRREGETLAGGRLAVAVPASGAVQAGVADLSTVPATADVVDLQLTLEGADGQPLSRYVQEVYLAAWRKPAGASTFAFRTNTVAWVEAESADGGGQPALRADESKVATASAGRCLGVHTDKAPSAAAEWAFKLPGALGQPVLLIRHAGDQPVAFRLFAAGKACGTATLAPTGGWGYQDEEWGWTALTLPQALAAGTLPVRFEFLNGKPVNVDCLALAAAGRAGPAGVRQAALAPANPAVGQQEAPAPRTAPFPAFRSCAEMVAATNAVLPSFRAVTRGPKFHWFGYYDKQQLDPGGRYLLSQEVDFEHRLPKSDEPVGLGMVDLADGDKWIALGQSRAWSWQQGCMLQWRPGSDHEVIWNDREGDRFVCRVLDVKTRTLRTLPRAIEHVSPDGRQAACADYSRIWGFRPGYGYAGIPDRYAAEPAPAELGVWWMDMATGENRMLASLADLAKVPYGGQKPADKHYVNHLQWSPDGKRLLLFDRWSGSGGMPTRVFTVGADGENLQLLSASGASHYMWRDPEHVLIWADGGYRLYKDDGTGEPKATLWTAPNGHQSYIPGTGNEWLVADTYPQGKQREQLVYLFHVPTTRFVLLGRFPSTYAGEWRCDTHPRISRDGRWVIIDSPHGGNGRQLYMLDIRPWVQGQGGQTRP